MPDNPDLSIIIVNFHAGGYLQKCIASLRAAVTGVDYEIIVVDNGSADGSVDFLRAVPKIPRVQLIEPHENLGFGAGCNLGASQAKGRWMHFLNPDTQVGPDINQLYMQIVATEPERNIVVTRLADENGTFVKSWFLLPTLQNYALAAVRPKHARFWYVGASVMMTRKLFDEFHGWATYSHMYAEDLDLSYRAARAHVTVRLSEVSVRHVQHGCTRTIWNDRERMLRLERANMLFYRHHGMTAQYYIATPLQIVRQAFRSFREAYERARAFARAIR